MTTIPGAGPFAVQTVGVIRARAATLDEAVAHVVDHFDWIRDIDARVLGWSGERSAASLGQRIIRHEGRTVARVTAQATGEHRVEVLATPPSRIRQSPAKDPLGHLVGGTRRRRSALA